MEKYTLPLENFTILENDLLRSRALLSLNATSLKIYLLMRSRTKVRHPKGKKPGRAARSCIEDEIVFTYSEVMKILNQGKKKQISSSTISRAFHELVDRGLIDILRPGSGKCKVCSLYKLSARWRLYGQPDFQQAKIHRNISLAGRRALQLINTERKAPDAFSDIEAGKERKTKTKDTPLHLA